MIIMDGAGDVARIGGKSPLQLARIPHTDYLSNIGVCGLMSTLYDDLPKGSIVAIMGLLGYDPHKYYPHGRASCEAKAIGIDLDEHDIAFRANLAFMKGNILDSYNAGYIKSEKAIPLINRINSTLRDQFPNFNIYHNSDFRNTLVVKDVHIHPHQLICKEPHENMGIEFDMDTLIGCGDLSAQEFVGELNEYIGKCHALIKDEEANCIFPWGASSALHLPDFVEHFRPGGKCCMVAHMDFLHGIAKAASIESVDIGNGDWNTDYFGKGKKVVELLRDGYTFICCHVNGPDEASHMGDLERKVYSIEQIDKYVVGPVIKYFESHMDELGSIFIAPDHYTNHFTRRGDENRSESHSRHPVPFVLWNNDETDHVTTYSEEDVIVGKYADRAINHLDAIKLMTRE